ncbi:MAG: tetratricopeptide repeat protein [Actinobacteria bacterium]|nr:tetratricopeptide repeat protein [Actinomycetota bacterium]MBV8480017.1 tetratricopeptide repeat protein [Actinomycetota bacterium]
MAAAAFAYELPPVTVDVDARDRAGVFQGQLELAWTEMYRGELDEAEAALTYAQQIAWSAHFDAADRAEVLYRQGCVALKRADVAAATELFTRALETNGRSPRPRPLLAAQAHEWRSRCHQFVRDWDAAARDAERSLELALDARDDLSQAHALFQLSLVAERRSDWIHARETAQQALAIYRRHGDVLATARMLNNLGGIEFLLGDIDAAIARLMEATETAQRAGSDADLAQAANSLAQVYLRTGRPAEARARALRAVDVLTGRVDFFDELGNAELIVAESLAAEGEFGGAEQWLDAAERTFSALGSTSHLANVWIARGDVARAAGRTDAAADSYRRAAGALADVHF